MPFQLNSLARPLCLTLAALLTAIGGSVYTSWSVMATPPDAPNLGNFTGRVSCEVVPDPQGGVIIDVWGLWTGNRAAAIAPLVTIDPTLELTIHLVVDGKAQSSMVIPAVQQPTEVRISLEQVSTVGPAYIGTKWVSQAGNPSYILVGAYPNGGETESGMSCIISDG